MPMLFQSLNGNTMSISVIVVYWRYGQSCRDVVSTLRSVFFRLPTLRSVFFRLPTLRSVSLLPLSDVTVGLV